MKRAIIPLFAVVSLLFIPVGESEVAEGANAMMLNPNHSCSFCHSVHMAPGSQLQNETDTEVLCLTCHGPGGSASTRADTHKGKVTCMGCHVPHSNVQNWLGGTNLMLVRDTVEDSRFNGNMRPVVFESRGTDVGDPRLHSFCDQDEDGNGIWDGVCDTCHNDETGKHDFTRPRASDHRHEAGRTCTNCHTHDRGFEPQED